MNTMLEPSLSFTLEGAEEDGGAVLLHDFRAFVKTLSDCLGLVEKRVLETTDLRHRITGLKSSSAYMQLEPVAKKKAKKPSSGAGRTVYEKFEKTVSALETGGEIDARFNSEDLKTFRKLAALTLGGKKRVKIAGIQLTTQFVATIDKILKGVIKAKGTVKGRVEKLNVHGCREFTLYPIIGNYSVICTFDEEQFESVQQAIKQNVTVHGTLSYRGDGPYPERVHVDHIERHPEDDKLPSLSALRGLMPDATGGKTAVDFIRGIRDE